MHPEDVAGSEKMEPYGLKLICGNPADSALSLGFMTYSGVFDRFPNLKLCMLHGGGFFPYHLGRFDQGWAVRSGPRAAQAKKAPSAYLKNIYYDDMIYRVDTIKLPAQTGRHRPYHGRHRLSFYLGRLEGRRKDRGLRLPRLRERTDVGRQCQAIVEAIAAEKDSS